MFPGVDSVAPTVFVLLCCARICLRYSRASTISPPLGCASLAGDRCCPGRRASTCLNHRRKRLNHEPGAALPSSFTPQKVVTDQPDFAAATLGVMSDGRFSLGLGAGERLNEHVVAAGWPGVVERHERLGEALDIIQGLRSGKITSYRGRNLQLDLLDQLGQDRDAHIEPDDRGADGHRRSALHHLGRGLLHDRDHRQGGWATRYPTRGIPPPDDPVRRRGGAG